MHKNIHNVEISFFKLLIIKEWRYIFQDYHPSLDWRQANFQYL